VDVISDYDREHPPPPPIEPGIPTAADLIEKRWGLFLEDGRRWSRTNTFPDTVDKAEVEAARDEDILNALQTAFRDVRPVLEAIDMACINGGGSNYEAAVVRIKGAYKAWMRSVMG